MNYYDGGRMTKNMLKCVYYENVQQQSTTVTTQWQIYRILREGPTRLRSKEGVLGAVIFKAKVSRV